MKVLIIVLVIMIVLFVVFVVWGSSNNASSTTKVENFNPEGKQPWIVRLSDRALSRFGPKLHLAVKTYDLSNLSDNSPMKAIVPADPDHKFRSAKFRLTQNSRPGCAKIQYIAPGDEGDLNPQIWPNQDDPNNTKPAASEVPPKEISFTILQSGGTITITHDKPSLKPCVVETD